MRYRPSYPSKRIKSFYRLRFIDSDRVLPSPLVGQGWFSVSFEDLKVDEMDVDRMYKAEQS
jgi:hypothetical protein